LLFFSRLNGILQNNRQAGHGWKDGETSLCSPSLVAGKNTAPGFCLFNVQAACIIATNTPQSEQSSLFQIFAFATIWHAALAGLVVHFSAEYIGHSFRFIC
jgi:hypothetical protein